jgi:hypothetical protein
MIWKTDWTAGDNLARQGITDIYRIINNYIAIKDDLNNFFGTKIKFAQITLNGYFTLPFADFLNKLESNIEKVKLFGVKWLGIKKVYAPYGNAPDFSDINRWEQNGATLENVINVSKENFIKCGAFSTGNIRLTQKIRRVL